MLTKLAELYNRQDIVDVYKYGVFNYLDYFDLVSRFKVDEYKSYQLRIIKRRSYVVDYYTRNFYYIGYRIDNKRHRDNDKPAIKYANGSKYWYQNGKRHRDNDKPAIECLDGSKLWYKNDKLHRDNDKPAVEYTYGRKEWWQNGELIRSYEN